MELTRTEQIWLHSNDILSQLCHFSKNLWNEANYQIRQEFFAGNRIPQYCELAGNLKMKDAMHKVSRYIVNWCIDHNIGKIIIGHNDNWKQESNIGKRNNQNFVSIPYYLLTHDIQYKAEELGIEVKLQGALNIIRKSEPNAFQKWNADGVGGFVLHPIRVNPLGDNNL